MRSTTARIRRLAAATAVALAATASPALAQDYSLRLSAPATAAVGQPAIMTASGQNPATDFFSSWLDVHAIPVSVMATCPAGYLNASQIAGAAHAQGGQAVAIAQREPVDASGAFSMPIAFTPTKAGKFLICAYSNDGATWTHAMASVVIDVPEPAATTPPPASQPPGATPTPSHGAARPGAIDKPRVTRARNRLVCGKGTWSGAPTRYAYRWVLDGKRQKGATGRTLKVTKRMRGRKARCGVTASNAAGATSALSGVFRVR